MAREKPLIVGMYEAHQRNKRAREREQLRAEREFKAEVARAEMLYAQQEEKARREQQRQMEAAQRAAKKAAADAQRADVAREREAKQAAADQTRREREAVIAAGVAEAAQETSVLIARREALEAVLLERARGLHAAVGTVEHAFNSEGPAGMAERVQEVLGLSPYPDGLSGSVVAECRPESRELLLEIELPRQQVVPATRSFRCVRSSGEIQPEPLRGVEVKKSYGQLIARVVLRTLAEAFDVTPPTLIQGIAVNGYVSSKDRATGKDIRPLLISVNATVNSSRSWCWMSLSLTLSCACAGF
jgi:restriction system protein